MPKIPINVGDIPTEETPMDEALVYKAFCKSLVMNDNPAVNGLYFLKAKYEVTEPDDYRGKVVMDNYIPIPPEVDASMDTKSRQRAMEAGIRFGRMMRSMGIAETPDGFDTEEAIGKELSFMIRNEEYQGRMIPRVHEYLI